MSSNVGISAGRDRGSVTPFVAVFVVALFLLVGLVFDGGRILAERRAAGAAATGAARAAAQAIDEDGVRQGDVHVDPATAAGRVAAYLDVVGMDGEVVDVDGSVITVEVRSTVDLHFLDLVGIPTRSVSARASAQVTPGIVSGGQP